MIVTATHRNKQVLRMLVEYSRKSRKKKREKKKEKKKKKKAGYDNERQFRDHEKLCHIKLYVNLEEYFLIVSRIMHTNNKRAFLLVDVQVNEKRIILDFLRWDVNRKDLNEIN